MLTRVAFVLALVIAAAVAAEKEEIDNEKYTTRYDKINVDMILNNQRLFNNYVMCLVAGYDDDCNQEGKFLKKVLAEALQTDCKRCSDKQREQSTKIVKFLKDKKPEVLKEIIAHYDPKGDYFKKHPEFAV